MGLREQFGGGNFGAGRGYQNVKIKDLIAQNLSFRILPAYGTLREKNQCSHFHKRHFGYKGESIKEPGKTYPKPFVCIEKTDREGMVTVDCAECRNIERHQEMLNDLVLKLMEEAKARGIIDAKKMEAAVDADPRVKSLKSWLKEHNLDKKIFFAVVLSNKALGILEMGSTARDNLKTACEAVRNTWKVEPISDFDRGAWFFPHCSAPGQQNNITTFEPVMDAAGDGAMRLKLAPLSEDDLKRALDALPDLTDAGLTFLTQEQIKALVECDGDPSTVDTIMGMSQPKQGQRAASPPAPDLGGGEEPPTAPPSDSPAPSADPVDDEIAAAQARLAEVMKKKEQQKPPPPAPTGTDPSPSPVPSDGSKPMSRDDFRKMFPVPAGRQATAPSATGK
jgi:hypothetical protein